MKYEAHYSDPDRRDPDRRPIFLLHSFYDETMNDNMNPQSIAQWIVDHPEHAHRLAMLIAELDYQRARQLAWDCDEASDYYTPEEDDYDDSMDGDHNSSMASAGWGTDEDYGCDDRM